MEARTALRGSGISRRMVAVVIAVLAALGFLLRRGVHGQSAALAIALLIILLLRIGIFAWNLRRQRAELERK